MLAAVSGAVAESGPAESSDESLRILPGDFALTHPESRQRIVVEKLRGEQFVGEVRDECQLQSSDESVVKIASGVAIPVGNGRATISAREGQRKASVAVSVSGQENEHVWSFRNHVESVLSKCGCNSGACHGARAGKNGFRLTLFGFDLDADYSYLTRQAIGRRIVPADPGRSLLLTKPTGTIPHKGGIRFEPDSLEYRVLAEWIAAGAPGPRPDDRVIERLEVFPKYSQQQLGGRQQLLVQAHFSDGYVEDVTRWAKYTTVNSSVASVSDSGEVQIAGSGEGGAKVWYLNLSELAFLSVPYPGMVAPEVYAQADRRTFIDEHLLRKLQSLNLPPAARADDATFLRRAFLDTVGILPTVDETVRFLCDNDADKRERLVESLLARPEFVDYWAYRWSDLLLITGDHLRPKAVETYYQWLRTKVAANTPWDQLVREIITASGSTHEYGPANFFALHQDPETMAETTAQAFLGLSINCARCHNHPLEKWTNDQYYGFANLFSRVRSKGWGGDYRSGDGLRVVFSDTQGELLQPSKGKPQPPRPLDGQPIPFERTTDRRIELADWLTSSANPYFARSITNRIWANFFGVGLVEKVDDMRITNPASNESLLAAASQFLVDHQFDLKELMRAILNSAAYQRSSESVPGNASDDRFYSRYYPRRLKAEILLDAMSAATGVPTEFKNAENKPYAAETRALQLPDASVDSYFLKTFGRPERLITCDCERSDEPSMPQVLHLLNGTTLNGKLQASNGRIHTWLESAAGPESIVKELYLAALSRYPTPEEELRLTSVLAGALADPANANERRQLLEDLVWSVLSSREFLFNH
jgi:hypothetical protein